MWYNIFTTENARKAFNYSGVALLAIGVSTLPIDLSFRLIILGVLSLVLWYVANPDR